MLAQTEAQEMVLFSFLYLKKIKISKIYVRFEIFQNYPLSPYGGRQTLSVIFFLQICNEIPDRGRAGGRGPIALPSGDRGSHPQARACRPRGGRQPGVRVRALVVC